MGTGLRVLVVEDDVWVRDSVVDALSAEPGVDATGCVRADEALALARRQPFDVALVDLGLPDRPGIEVITELRRIARACASVVFTVFDDAPTILAALRAGARGYILKRSRADRLVPHLREARNGGMPLSPAVASLLVEATLGKPAAPSRDGELTERETQLLSLLARGATYRQCAVELGIGVGTVQSYVKSIYSKLDVTSKAEAAVVAVRLGLVR